jgi:hypothetical protein
MSSYLSDTRDRWLEIAAKIGQNVCGKQCRVAEVTGNIAHNVFRRNFRRKGQHSIYWRGAKQFTEFLRAQQGIVATKAALAPPELVAAFEHWMQIHRGVKPSTLITYRQHVMDLLSSLDPQPEQFNATKLHGFILTYAKRNGRAVAQTRVKAARMFLRFLIATERCQPGLDAAIPTIAEWRLASLPRYLPPADVERVLPSSTCAVLRRRFSSGCESHPATFAPAGSNRSSHGGNEVAEAFGVEGHKVTWRAYRPQRE